MLAVSMVIGGIVIVDYFDGSRLWGEMIKGIGLILAAVGLYFYGGFLLNAPPIPRTWSIYMAVMARVSSIPALNIMAKGLGSRRIMRRQHNGIGWQPCKGKLAPNIVWACCTGGVGVSSRITKRRHDGSSSQQRPVTLTRSMI